MYSCGSGAVTGVNRVPRYKPLPKAYKQEAQGLYSRDTGNRADRN